MVGPAGVCPSVEQCQVREECRHEKQRREYEKDAWIESSFPKTSLMAHQFSHIEGHELEGRVVVVVMRCRKSLYGFIQGALHAFGMLCADVDGHKFGRITEVYSRRRLYFFVEIRRIVIRNRFTTFRLNDSRHPQWLLHVMLTRELSRNR